MSLTTKLWLLITALFLTVSTQAQDLTRALWGPSMAEIRTKAEAGDPEAQCKLAHAYEFQVHGKTNAIFWYRKAARQGNVDAQCRLGHLLPKGEDLKWMLLAANRNYFQAQMAMSHICETRNKDKIEACKWMILAVKQQPYHRASLDHLTLKLTSSEYAEAQKRADAFVPTKPGPVEPELKLQSIIGAGNNRLALINGHTFKTGEQAQLKIDDETVSAKCLEITVVNATIEINGSKTTLSLH